MFTISLFSISCALPFLLFSSLLYCSGSLHFASFPYSVLLASFFSFYSLLFLFSFLRHAFPFPRRRCSPSCSALCSSPYSVSTLPSCFFLLLLPFSFPFFLLLLRCVLYTNAGLKFFFNGSVVIGCRVFGSVSRLCAHVLSQALLHNVRRPLYERCDADNRTRPVETAELFLERVDPRHTVLSAGASNLAAVLTAARFLSLEKMRVRREFLKSSCLSVFRRWKKLSNTLFFIHKKFSICFSRRNCRCRQGLLPHRFYRAPIPVHNL